YCRAYRWIVWFAAPESLRACWLCDCDVRAGAVAVRSAERDADLGVPASPGASEQSQESLGRGRGDVDGIDGGGCGRAVHRAGRCRAAAVGRNSEESCTWLCSVFYPCAWIGRAIRGPGDGIGLGAEASTLGRVDGRGEAYLRGGNDLDGLLLPA